MRVEDHLDADSACAKRNGIGTELKMVSVSYWLRDEGWLDFFFFFFLFEAALQPLYLELYLPKC